MSIFGFLRRASNRPTNEQIQESLAKQFALAIVPQLLRLERVNGFVPIAGATGYGRATGYLLGVCEAIIRHNMISLTDSSHLGILVRYAFSEVYGSEGPALGFASIEGLKTYDPAMLEGHYMGQQEMSDVYAEKPWFTPMGFYQLAQE